MHINVYVYIYTYIHTCIHTRIQYTRKHKLLVYVYIYNTYMYTNTVSTDTPLHFFVSNFCESHHITPRKGLRG